jgi:hypothetical protein
MNKGESLYELDKIPDDVIFANLLADKGKRDAYIMELEDTIKVYEKKRCTKCVGRMQEITNLQNKVKRLEKELEAERVKLRKALVRGDVLEQQVLKTLQNKV